MINHIRHIIASSLSGEKNELKHTEVDADSTQTENSCCHAVKGNDAERYTFICLKKIEMSQETLIK